MTTIMPEASNIDIEVTDMGSIIITPRISEDDEEGKQDFFTSCWVLPTRPCRPLDQSYTTTNTYSDDNNPHTERELCGAATAGGLAGLCCGGPLCGILSASGAAMAVTSKSKAGEVARDGGEAVAKVGDKLHDFDQEHQIVEKTKTTASQIGHKLRDFDQEHHIVENTKIKVKQGYEWVEKRIIPNDSYDERPAQQPVSTE